MTILFDKFRNFLATRQRRFRNANASWYKSILLDKLKSSWLKDGWLRVSARKDEGDAMLLLSGILYPPKMGNQQRLNISGEHEPDTQYGLFNADHAYLGANAFKTAIPLRDLRSDDVLSICAASIDSAAPIPWHQSWHLLPSDDLPFPPGPNQERISGQQAIDDQWFYFAGGTFVHKLSSILAQYFSMDIAKTDSILDWGCGCGRLTRHLSKYTEAAICGVDIDSYNVKWCSENIPRATFSLVDPWKPLPFEDASFDFIIGHSVFTHLTEEAQFFWLDELCRVLKPGGALLVTIMSSFGILNDRLSEREIDSLLQAGYLDVGHQNDGVDKIAPGYYRKVYHRPEYIHQNWSARFDILDILDCYADHQALVVCKKVPIA